MSKQVSQLPPIIENFIIIAILAVLAQTFLEDFAVASLWSIKTRNGLLVAGFCFDLFFTIEFITRSMLSKKRGGFRKYFLFERGWVDLIASVPLVLFNSGPAFILLMFPEIGVSGTIGSVLNSFKTVKAVRVTRILRLLRIIKIFGKIQNTDSPMANRHIATISTMSVVGIVSIIIIFSTAGITGFDNLRIAKEKEYSQIFTNIVNSAKKHGKINDKLINYYFREQLQGTKTNIIMVTNSNLDKPVIIQNYTAKEINNNFKVKYNPHNFSYKFANDKQVSVIQPMAPYFLYIDNTDFVVMEAKINMLMLMIIIGIIIIYMLFYTRHFAMTITDPIHVMKMGFIKGDYNLEVLVPPEYDEDEIFDLAKLFNQKYLPMKLKEKEEGQADTEGVISLDDFINAQQ